MAFNPCSTIHICNVPIDTTYKHQIYFGNVNDQTNYFAEKTVKSYAEYLTVRKTLPGGGLQSSIKVASNIDDLYAVGANYLRYQNANHGNKWFYAFINNLVYSSEEVTEIIFETDVYQTWLFDVELLPSYVAREHSATDNIGDNIVPEKFNFQDFEYATLLEYTKLDKWGYLVGTTERQGTDGLRGNLLSGIYQGLYFYYYDNFIKLNDFLDAIEAEGGDCVQFICVIPEFCKSANTTADQTGIGFLDSSNKPAEYDLDIVKVYNPFNGYTPKNKKLYTNPFYNILVTNHNGEEAVYNFEDFDSENIKFTMYGDVSANPSITLIPRNYKGINQNYDAGISIGGFPQCAFNSDTFKLWLAKNQFALSIDKGASWANIGMGALSGGISLATGSIGGTLGGVSQITSGVNGLLNTMSAEKTAEKEPNKSHSGSAKNNLLTALNLNRYSFFIRKLKRSYAETIDSFFTMYGYQTNKLKAPNTNVRKAFTYLQTIDVNIIGRIPSEDMEKLKAMYNSGVTLWKHTADIGNYNVDNSIE